MMKGTLTTRCVLLEPGLENVDAPGQGWLYVVDRRKELIKCVAACHLILSLADNRAGSRAIRSRRPSSRGEPQCSQRGVGC